MNFSIVELILDLVEFENDPASSMEINFRISWIDLGLEDVGMEVERTGFDWIGGEIVVLLIRTA